MPDTPASFSWNGLPEIRVMVLLGLLYMPKNNEDLEILTELRSVSHKDCELEIE